MNWQAWFIEILNIFALSSWKNLFCFCLFAVFVSYLADIPYCRRKFEVKQIIHAIAIETDAGLKVDKYRYKWDQQGHDLNSGNYEKYTKHL